MPPSSPNSATEEPGTTPGSTVARGARWRSLAGLGVQIAGWLSFALIVCALVLENLPGLERVAEELIQRRIGSEIANELTVGEIDVLWLERSIALDELSLGPTGDEVRAKDVVARIGWSVDRGFHVDRIAVGSGSVHITKELAKIEFGESGSDARSSIDSFDALRSSPEVVVRDVAISVDTEGDSAGPEVGLAVGTIDLSMSRGTSGHAEIVGRLQPAVGVVSEPTGVIWLNGVLGPDRAVEIDGVARSLALNFESLPDDSALASLDRFDPIARVDLACRARFEVGRSILPTVFATLSVSKGSLVLPWLEASESRRVNDVAIAMEVDFDPAQSSDPFDPSVWSARGTMSATWEDLRGTSAFRYGDSAPDDMVFDGWVHLPDAPLGETLVELLNEEKSVMEIEAMLAPEGTSEVAIGLRLPRTKPALSREAQDLGHDPAETIARAPVLERFLSIRPRSNAALSYHGTVNKLTGERDIGFPLPVHRVAGDVTWSIRSQGEYPGQLAFYDATAYHGSGPLSVQGSLHFQPRWRIPIEAERKVAPAPFHLAIETEGLPIDGEFESGMRGLYGVPGIREILPTWNPSGGDIDFALQLWRRADQRELSLAIDASLDGVGARWVELGVPIEDARGTFQVLTDGEGPDDGSGYFTIDLEADSTVARGPVKARGKVVHQGKQRSLSWIEVEAKRVNTRSRDLHEELGRKDPGTLRTLEESGVAGFVDLLVSAVHGVPFLDSESMREDGPLEHALTGGLRVSLDLKPASEALTLQPSAFSLFTRDVVGALRVQMRFPPIDPLVRAEQSRRGLAPARVEPVTAMAGRIQGTWQQQGPSVPVVASVATMPDRALRVRAYGAGLDIANDALIGELIAASRAANADEAGASDPIDTDRVQVAGRVDFGASFEIVDNELEPVRESELGVEARLDRLAIGGNQILRDVSAHLTRVEETGEWIGERIDATLGRTPVELHDIAWIPGEEGSVFRTRISARGLPIDEEHLGFFLDPATKQVVLDDLSARGVFDLEDALLTLERGRNGSMAVRLLGTIALRDAFVDLGAPVELGLVESVEVDLAHTGGGLRARADVDGAFGKIAGRRLENARMALTYVEPRLVIEGLDGRFEGGRLRAIGSKTSPAANLFSIDLAEPFPFRLSAAMDDVDIGEFLRGVFDSDFANRGIMDMDLQLSGDFEHLTELTGGGTIRVEDSALWSIPVFQALSTRLGIDSTVLFRTMLCDYTIEDGALILERMRVDSDLLSLVGKGSIDFEGAVTSDLEVRYGLVDRLGPFTRLLYRVQNSLLRVSVRGTMERPTVMLRGLISQLFQPDEERDRLPLPGFSKRPKRF